MTASEIDAETADRAPRPHRPRTALTGRLRGHPSRRPVCAAGVALLALVAASPSAAQRTGENVVISSASAFGTSVGLERTGLYLDDDVRGFSALTAGNLRIEGVYFDRQGVFPTRLAQSSAIRVGLTAQAYPFPAPTGIVDYRLRFAPEKPVLSILTGVNSRGAVSFEGDLQRPFPDRHLTLSTGFGYTHDEKFFGNNSEIYSAAVVARWRPAPGYEIAPFLGWLRNDDEEAAPVIFGTGDRLPPKIRRRVFFGQGWAENNNDAYQLGVLAQLPLPWGVSARGGAGLSIFDEESRFADLFQGVGPDGLPTRHTIIGYPEQKTSSRSGEILLSRTLRSSATRHDVQLLVRVRDKVSDYGGSAAYVATAPMLIGVPQPLSRPTFAFGPRSRDTFDQVTLGAGYSGTYADRLVLTGGIQYAAYRKSLRAPGAQRDTTNRSAMLGNVSATVRLGPRLSGFAAYSRGLEDAGVAPDVAANRNAALPAILSRQAEADLRWEVSPAVRLITGVFEIEKPYFAADAVNRYRIVGQERHRGAEISLSGRPTPQLDVVLGAVILSPHVTVAPELSALIGSRPIGPANSAVRASLNYRTRFDPRLSFDAALTYNGRRVASRDNRLTIAPQATLDLGARYRLSVGKAETLLRVSLTNATNAYTWRTTTSGALTYSEPARLVVSLTADY